MKLWSLLVLSLLLASSIMAGPGEDEDEVEFSTHLSAKFQVKGCTICHDFHEKKLGGLAYGSHKGRTPNSCVVCHTKEVTGFAHADEWFARPNLYTSGMTSKQICESIKTSLNADFKNKTLLARDLKKHLLDDPRVLWGIEGATPNSGNLPGKKKQTDLAKGGLREWTEQVNAWIQGGMSCD